MLWGCLDLLKSRQPHLPIEINDKLLQVIYVFLQKCIMAAAQHTLFMIHTHFDKRNHLSMSAFIIYSSASLFILLTVHHELGHNENRLLGDDSMESYKSVMLQLFHEVSFLKKGLRLHRSFFQRFDGNLLGVLVVAYQGGSWRLINSLPFSSLSDPCERER